ncbi:cysteine desulfurase family protein [Paenibacillus sp. IHBB 10380]|uniref:cysteine desulfurase family protein n=1 Tax=Paenibacillus sp. IHBB 10380 TaxID=1566358 RepID=UPI0005CFBCC9|nr:cysteine desulfurase family protein [Paenibacillus sp. IHBB 10380]AJS57721.1 cysteine desulfurase [Paenibacillus sp. IHBB 10380]
MIYWDHAASTPPYEDVIRTISEVMKEHYGNPSSMHTLGENAGKLIKRAREGCASTLGVNPMEVVFTSGATEGNNMAIKGTALQHMKRGKHIITTEIEHASVYESFLQLQQWGFDVTFLPVNSSGQVDPMKLASEIRKDTTLVSIMHVNNEVGAIQPIEAIGKLIKQKNRRTLFHVDGVQGFGKLSVDLRKWDVDLYTLSSHKFRGPKGTGLLYVREGVALTPLLTGGSQELGMRAGTENIPHIVAMAKAMRIAGERQETFTVGISLLRNRLLHTLREIPGIVLNSDEACAPHIVNFSYPGMKSEVFLHALDELDMLVSTKSACSSKLTEPSQVLLSMGRTSEEASSGIRISLGDCHTENDVEQLEYAIRSVVERLQPFLQRGMKR